MSSMFDGIEGYKFRGRKLILEWGKLKIEISKLPYQNEVKDLIFDLVGSDVVLANVYEGPDGHMVDEILGKPAGRCGNGTHLDGMSIEDYFTDDSYWKTVGEAQGGLNG